MDIKYLKTMLLNKIKENNYNFNSDEKELIKTNSSILLELLKKITKDNINDEIIEIINDTNKITLSDEIITYLIPLTEIIRNINTEKELKQGIINSYDCENEILKKYITNENYEVKKIILNENMLNFLLDIKKYDLIAQAEPLKGYISDKTFKRILEEFPFNQYYLNPYQFYIHYKDMYLKKDNIKEYNLFLTKYINLLPFGCLAECIKYTEDKNQIKELLLNKIENANANLEIFNPENVDEIFNLEKQDVQKLILKSLEKNNLSIFFTSYISYNEEIINEICNKIKNGYEIKQEKIYNAALLNNKKFIETLIEKGYITQAKDSIHFNEFKNKIIELIYENNKYIKNIKVTETKKLEDIIISMINNNNYNLEIKENVKLSEKISDTIINKIIATQIEQIKENPFLTNIIPNLYNPEELYDKLIENEQVEKMIIIFQNYSNKISNPFKNKKIEKEIENSYFIANNIFELFKKDIVKNSEIRNIYIKLDNEYVDKILNVIEKNKIIQYITSNQIHEIINLEEKKFQKIINLFPQKEYNMNDLETIYDSFKQEEFSIKNPETKSIFAKIKNLLNNNNYEYVELIEKLKTAFDKKLVKQILEKYPEEIENINEQYFDLIILKLKSNNNIEKEKYIDIVHIISEHYIAKKREQYRNQYNLIEELNIEFEYDDKEIETEITKHLLKEPNFYEEVVNSLKTMDNVLVKECIEYYLYHKNENPTYHEQIIKINIRSIIKAAKK